MSILTFCVICWYTYETKKLSASSVLNNRIIALNYYIQKREHLCNISQIMERPELVGNEIGDCSNLIEKIEQEINSFI